MTSSAGVRVRDTHVERLDRQISAIAHWNDVRRQRERMAAAAGSAALPPCWRPDVLARVQKALQEHTRSSLLSTGWPMPASPPVTAVIADGDDWFAARLSEQLAAREVTVVAVTNDGEEALGVLIAEQPDLLVAADSLSMLAGAELLGQAAVFAPSTLRAAHVSRCAGGPAVLDAGPHASFPLGTAPHHVVEALSALLMWPQPSLASAV